MDVDQRSRDCVYVVIEFFFKFLCFLKDLEYIEGLWKQPASVYSWRITLIKVASGCIQCLRMILRYVGFLFFPSQKIVPFLYGSFEFRHDYALPN